MYELVMTTKFKKDLKKVAKDKKENELVRNVLKLLQAKGVKGIPSEIRPHRLLGNYKDHWECHIKPDLLLIWFQMESPNVIKLIRIGSHSALFK